MKIYLAGKISRYDWRCDLVDGLKEYSWDSRPKIFGTHEYVGPFFNDLSCGHSVAQDAHGDEELICLEEDHHGCLQDLTRDQWFEKPNFEHRRELSEKCLTAIESADLVFVWLGDGHHDLKCYGTMVEIGYAKAWQKKIVVACYNPVSVFDLWFSCVSANNFLFGCINPKTTLAKLLNTKPNYYEYIRSEEWKAKAHAAKERAQWRCQVCNTAGDARSLNAHHRTYERLGNELPEDITVLCEPCHGLFHANGKMPVSQPASKRA